MSSEHLASVAEAMDGHQAAVGARRRRWILALLAVTVIAALAIGQTASVSTAASDESGLSLRVEHPRYLMSGTPAPLTVTIDVPAGQDTVRLTLCRSLPDSLDFQNWYPNPASESGSSSTVSYSFEAQQGLSLRVRLDARSQPNLSPGVTDCDVTAQSGSATATVTFSIWVLP